MIDVSFRTIVLKEDAVLASKKVRRIHCDSVHDGEVLIVWS